MRSRDFAAFFACHTAFSPATKNAIQAQPTMDQAQQQANQPNFSPQGGGGIQPPAPSQQPPPVWGQAPPGQDQQQYQQVPPRRSPYA